MPSAQLNSNPTVSLRTSEYLEMLTSLRPLVATLLEACESKNLGNAQAADCAYCDAYRALNLPSNVIQPQSTSIVSWFAALGRDAAANIYNYTIQDFDSMKGMGELAKVYIDWVDTEV